MHFAVLRPAPNEPDIDQDAVARIHDASQSDGDTNAAVSSVFEAMLLKCFKHNNIIRVLGWCRPTAAIKYYYNRYRDAQN